MLIEIYCDKFIQPKITFKEGLNVVLGSKDGDNSIGKTTMLLIIDFVYGGTTYFKSTDIKKHVGNHYIYFKLRFENKIYSFCRNYFDYNNVWECDDNYNKQSIITLDEYKSFLSNMYQLNYTDFSFRDAVSLYSRIYGKKNYDEHSPLQINQERYDNGITRLIKLFNLFKNIKSHENQCRDLQNRYDTFIKSQKQNLIPNINKKQYDDNIKQINELERKINELETRVDYYLVDADSIKVDNFLYLKKELSYIKRLKNKLLIKLESINENNDFQFKISSKNISDLKVFFPDANFKKIDEIEKFHKKISQIFNNELNEEKNKFLNCLDNYNNSIKKYEEEIMKLVKTNKLSTNILSNHSRLITELENRKKENQSYDELLVLKKENQEIKNELCKIKNEIVAEIINKLNRKIKELNDTICGQDNNTPMFILSNSKYKYLTPNDDGTGTAYKGLIVYDLSVLDLTNLPFIIHDSFLFKNESDGTIEKILEIYEK